MLRRRKKGPPREETRSPQGHATQRSRRRARPGAEVPRELRLDPATEGAVLKPPRAPAPKPQAPRSPAPRADSPKAEAPPPKPVPPKPVPPKSVPPKSVPAKPSTPPREPVRESHPPQGTAKGNERRRHGDVILVTGFEPFGGETMNPSWEVCERLPREIGGARVETCLVPCVFRRAIEVVADAIERFRPVIVLSIGQAGGRSVLGVERVAINVDDARIADNDGRQPIDEPVAPDGPAAHFATLPVKAMAEAIRRAGVPAEVSNTAGTFVCNHLMYGVLHVIAARGFDTRAGFIHVPYADEQVTDKPPVASMAIAAMVKGIAAALEAARATTNDIRQAEGRLD